MQLCAAGVFSFSTVPIPDRPSASLSPGSAEKRLYVTSQEVDTAGRFPGWIGKGYGAIVTQMNREEAARAYQADPASFFDRILAERHDDRSLIDPEWSRMETRFHYNLVENAIIRWLVAKRIRPEQTRVLDVGFGNGHWLDFYVTVVGATEVVGVDFSQVAVDRQTRLFASHPQVRLVRGDISEDLPLSGPFGLVNAIGVMFHITDDARWTSALARISGLCMPGASLIIGGDFGTTTEMRGVMRKVRALHVWEAELSRQGFAIERVERYDWFKGSDAGGITDNVLVARKRGSHE